MNLVNDVPRPVRRGKNRRSPTLPRTKFSVCLHEVLEVDKAMDSVLRDDRIWKTCEWSEMYNSTVVE